MQTLLKTLAILFIGLTLLSCNSTASKKRLSKTNRIQVAKPDYQVALQFINDYVSFCCEEESSLGLLEWVNKRADLTEKFKTELKRILDEAEKIDPELGLGFDPILDAQDNPAKFVIAKTDREYLIVRGVNWTDFKLTLKLKFQADKWFVDGAGIVNVPENKKIAR